MERWRVLFDPDPYYDSNSFIVLPAFFLGVAICVAAAIYTLDEGLSRRAGNPGLLIVLGAVAVAAFLACFGWGFRDRFVDFTVLLDVVAAALIIVAAVALSRRAV